MPCGSPVPLASPTSTRHQLIVLPFFCGSGCCSRTRPTTSGPVDPAAVEPLLLEADPDEALGREVGAGRPGRDVDELAQPVDGYAHQISIPNCAREAHVSLDDVVHVGDAVRAA